MNILRDGRAFLRHIGHDPTRWARFQFHTLRLAIFPHDNNNDFRKLTTTALFGVWIALTLGLGSVPSQHYTAITALVFMILGQQWELEKFRFGPLEFSGSDDDE